MFHINSSLGNVHGNSPSNPFVIPTSIDAKFSNNKSARSKNNEMTLISTPTHSSKLRDNSVILPTIDQSNQKLSLCKHQHIQDHSISDFVSKKREIFLVEYSLNVKREDLLALENTALDKENELIISEKLLEEDAINFDEFLRNTNVLTQRTVASADICIKEKMERFYLTKKLNNEILLLRTEISRNNEFLLQLQLYKEFLTTLSPNLIISINNQPQFGDVGVANKSFLYHSSSGIQMSTLILQNGSKICNHALPNHLSVLLSAMEENNLSLILNSQEIEEALEDLVHSRRYNEERLLLHVSSLDQQISLIEANIFHENFVAQNLEYKAKMFSYGEFKEEDQDILEKIDKNVQKVYINCIGHNEANIGTLQMLSSIENRVEELFDILEGLPGEKVKNAEIFRAKERRLLIREKKIEEERFNQDERMKRSIARANANTRVYNGRKLQFRSLPPKDKQFEPHLRHRKLNTKEEDDQMYFFS